MPRSLKALLAWAATFLSPAASDTEPAQKTPKRKRRRKSISPTNSKKTTSASSSRPAGEKVAFVGLIVGVQPRIRLTRSFGERSHTYLGFSLRVHGAIDDDERDFVAAVGKATHDKYAFRRGDIVRGRGWWTTDEPLHTTDLHRVSGIEILERDTVDAEPKPPWHTLAPPLMVYRERGHRRLDAKRYAKSCSTCVWGCEMAVDMIIDQWNPSVRKYRRETWCYGPLSCSLYSAGPKRRVPGRKGMVYVEDDWIDEDDVNDRGPDD